MNRSLKLSMLVALALGSGHAMAVSLGQAQVKSALGQPLLVEVPLNSASAAELRNLTVRLASSEAYARAGISDGRTSIPLHFSVINQGGGKVIRITSKAPVGDPYLDLLLEVNGGGSESVREVAILLDPPGAPSAAPAAPSVAAASPPRQTMRSQTPAETRPSPIASTASTASATVSDGKYGPVKRGQTLTGIAKNTLPAGVDINQMLLAYKQANPDAFFRDNVNALKTGAVLRVPSAADARAMAAAAAVTEVRRQNSDWRAGSTSKPVALADAGARRGSGDSSSGTTADRGDRLALVPAKNGQGTPAASAGGKSGSAKDLRQELLRSKENVASLQQQGEDLKTRLNDLNDINDKNKSLLSLKDSEIADLQSKLAAARKAAHLPPAVSTIASAPQGAPAAAASSTMADPAGGLARANSSAGSMTSAMATSAMASASTTVAAAPTRAAASSPAPVASATPPVSRPGPSRKGTEQPWYMQAWAWAAAAGIVVVLLLLALLGRRKSVKEPAMAGSSLADRFDAGAPIAAEQDDESMFTADDVDQDELLDQLAEHPDDIHLHLELVTLYYSRRDVEHFEAAAEAMYAHVSDPQQDEWQDVVHMGEDLTPQHPLFVEHDDVQVSDFDARKTFDIDHYAADDDIEDDGIDAAVSPLPEQRNVSENSFNFDLPARSAETLPEHHDAAVDAYEPAPVIEPESPSAPAPLAEADSDFGTNYNSDEFNDDPIDTKLDLARAYLDMGDGDGATAMLEEVLKEGSQTQQETARSLLNNMA